MRIASNRPGLSFVEQAIASCLRKQAASPEYQKWHEGISAVAKQFADMTRKMLSGGFMKNRPDQAENMRRFLVMLDPNMLRDPGGITSLVGTMGQFDKDLQDVYAAWQKSIGTIERQKAVLQNYFSLWDQIKGEIQKARDIVTPAPKAAPMAAPAQAPSVSTQAPGTPKLVGV